MTRGKNTSATSDPLTESIGIVTAALFEIAQGSVPPPIVLNENEEQLAALQMAFNGALAQISEMKAANAASPKSDNTPLTLAATGAMKFVSQSTDESGKISSLTESVLAGLDGIEAASSVLDSVIQEVVAATDRSGTNVTAIAVSTEEMTSTVAEIAQSAEQARGVADNAVRSVESASKKVDSLGTAAKQISNVTETIVEIAEQTKLLALNATIEAARAGEAGKGFAVVANEVKELAQQTNSATSDIREKINAIQEATLGTIHEINGITQVIAEVSEYVSAIATATEEQSVTTREITEMISNASGELNDVNSAAKETASAAEQMSVFIQEVKGYSAEMSPALEAFTALQQSISTRLEKLVQIVNPQ